MGFTCLHRVVPGRLRTGVGTWARIGYSCSSSNFWASYGSGPFPNFVARPTRLQHQENENLKAEFGGSPAVGRAGLGCPLPAISGLANRQRPNHTLGHSFPSTSTQGMQVTALCAQESQMEGLLGLWSSCPTALSVGKRPAVTRGGGCLTTAPLAFRGYPCAGKTISMLCVAGQSCSKLLSGKTQGKLPQLQLT